MWGIVNGERICWLEIVVIDFGDGLGCGDSVLFLFDCVKYIWGR